MSVLPGTHLNPAIPVHNQNIREDSVVRKHVTHPCSVLNQPLKTNNITA